MEKIIEEFGRTVRRLRIAREMSQEQLGFAANLQRKYVSALELGQKQPTLTTIVKLAHALEVTPSELLRLAENSVSE